MRMESISEIGASLTTTSRNLKLMKYSIESYDKAYNSIVASYGKDNPGIIEAASNIVGMSWDGPGSYEIRTSRASDVSRFTSPESMSTILYGLMLREGLNIIVTKKSN